MKFTDFNWSRKEDLLLTELVTAKKLCCSATKLVADHHEELIASHEEISLRNQKAITATAKKERKAATASPKSKKLRPHDGT